MEFIDGFKLNNRKYLMEQGVLEKASSAEEPEEIDPEKEKDGKAQGEDEGNTNGKDGSESGKEKQESIWNSAFLKMSNLVIKNNVIGNIVIRTNKQKDSDAETDKEDTNGETPTIIIKHNPNVVLSKKPGVAPTINLEVQTNKPGVISPTVIEEALTQNPFEPTVDTDPEPTVNPEVQTGKTDSDSGVNPEVQTGKTDAVTDPGKETDEPDTDSETDSDGESDNPGISTSTNTDEQTGNHGIVFPTNPGVIQTEKPGITNQIDPDIVSSDKPGIIPPNNPGIIPPNNPGIIFPNNHGGISIIPNLEGVGTIKLEQTVVSDYVSIVENSTDSASGGVIEFDDNGNKIETWYTDDGKIRRQVKYDENDNIISETNYDEYERAIEESTFDAEGNLVAKTTWEYYSESDKKPLRTDYTYNPNGTLSSETSYFKSVPDQISSQKIYDENGNLVSETVYSSYSPYNKKSYSEYYPNGSVKLVIEYDSQGRKDSEIEYYENGNVKLEIAYDYKGEKDSEIEYYENGNVKLEIAYDYKGEKDSEIEYYENGNVKRKVAYDGEGRLLSEYEYYENGNIKHKKEYTSSSYYRLEKEQEYDSDGNLILEIVYNYDRYPDMENLLSTTHKIYKDGVLTSSQDYNLDGQMTSETFYDANGLKTNTLEYNSDGKVTSETKYDENGKKVAYLEYNSDGKVTSETKYDENGKKVAYLEYDSDGRVASETQYHTNGNISFQANYTYKQNDDGTYLRIAEENGRQTSAVLMDADGNIITELVKGGDFWTATVYYDNGVIKSKTVYYNNFEKSTEKTYNEDGSLKSEAIYNTTTGFKDTETIYNTDGTKVVRSYNSSNGLISDESTYDSAGNLLSQVLYNNGVKTSEITWDEDKYAIVSNFNPDGTLKDQTMYKPEGYTVKVLYENGVKVSETTYKFENVVKEVLFDASGNVTSEKLYMQSEQNGDKTLCTFADATGALIGKSASYVDSNGNIREDYEDLINNTTKNRYVSSTSGLTYEDTYDNESGLMNSRVVYKTDGTPKESSTYDNVTGLIKTRTVYSVYGTVDEMYTYEYENYVDSKNYTRRMTDSKGNVTKEVYENGVKVRSHYYDASTGAVKTTYYDSKGNAKSDAREGLSGYVGGPLGSKIYYKTIYDMIVTGGGTTVAGFWVSFQQAVREAVGGDATWTIAFIEWARKNYNGTPSGCDEKYTNYLDTDYADFIRDDIIAGLTDDGYDPEWVKGYHFSDTSALSQSISKNSYFEAYIKKNIKKLLSGDISGLGRLDFNPGKNYGGIIGGEQITAAENDLYYSLHGTDVVDAKLEGTKLTLTIYDLYDFAENEGGMLGKTGAAAQKDGKLIPFFMLIEVTIDLRDYFSTEELKALGVL